MADAPSSLFKTVFFHCVLCPTARGDIVQKLIFPSVFRGARSIYKRKEEIKKIHRFVGVRNVKYSGNVDEGGWVCLFSFYPVGGKGERQQSRSSTARESR